MPNIQTHTQNTSTAILIALSVLLFPFTASAATFYALQDATLYSNGNANGGGPAIFAGVSGNGTVQRGLLEFDLSSISPGSIITSVTLTLHVNAIGSANTTDTITLNTLSQNWNAGLASTGGTIKGGGSGTTPNAGDATWTSSGSTAWTPGGAFNTSISDSVLISDIGFYNFSGAGLLTDIQSWVDNASTNNGWIIRGNELTTSSSKRFSSSENTGNGGANVPLLTIE